VRLNNVSQPFLCSLIVIHSDVIHTGLRRKKESDVASHRVLLDSRQVYLSITARLQSPLAPSS
ncbi:hypothetical protein, partial [Escherichia coli]|uniref:hypothetical protein n=1 Tax=Escherichia coli TaxID=562 RepID=UPI001BCBCBD2